VGFAGRLVVTPLCYPWRAKRGHRRIVAFLRGLALPPSSETAYLARSICESADSPAGEHFAD